MFKNYLKIALRNFRKDKLYSLINVLGLSIGLTAFIIIAIFVQHELSFDNFHLNSKNIYRLVVERKTPNGISIDAVTPPLLAPSLENDFPEIQKSVRILKIDNPVPLVSSGGNSFYEKEFSFVDPSGVNIFTIPFVVGNLQTALSEPNSVIITEKTAVKYFGSANPLGKMLRLNNSIDLNITGVIKNFPNNSTINADFLVSFSTLYEWLGKDYVDSWQNNLCHTYVLLSGNTSKTNIEKRLPGFIDGHVDKSTSLKNIYLQPMNRIHLFSNADFGLNSGDDIQNISLLSALGIFILLIACFNFINLATTRFIKRSKETGVRKLLGATRKQLAYQFFGESFLLTIISLFISLLISAVVFPNMGSILGINISFNLITNWKFVVFPVLLILVIGLLSGSYPAFYMSSLKPVKNLYTDAKIGFGHSKSFFRKIVITFQFVLTNILIIGSLVVYNQLSFMQNKKLGFDAGQVVVVPIRDEGLRQNHEALKNRLFQFNGVQNIGAAALLPGGPVGKTRFKVQENLRAGRAGSETGTMSMLWVDTDFIKSLGIKISAGRDFSKNYSTDESEAFIINEEAAKRLGFKNSADAVDKSFELTGSKKGKIIGVVKDFHFTSLQNKIDPVVLHIWPWLNYLLIRTDSEQIPSVIAGLEKIWNEFDPNNPFEYNFLSDNFNRFYEAEKKLGKVSAFFTSTALIIALMGLFSLSAYSVERKVKEIGIRKVLGAEASAILIEQLKEFSLPVVLAITIAFPISYYMMSLWLQNYAYRIDVDVYLLMFAGLITLATSLLTVCYHSVKAALTNPIESLRYE